MVRAEGGQERRSVARLAVVGRQDAHVMTHGDELARQRLDMARDAAGVCPTVGGDDGDPHVPNYDSSFRFRSFEFWRLHRRDPMATAQGRNLATTNASVAVSAPRVNTRSIRLPRRSSGLLSGIA